VDTEEVLGLVSSGLDYKSGSGRGRSCGVADDESSGIQYSRLKLVSDGLGAPQCLVALFVW